MYLTTPLQRCDLMYLLTMGAFYGLAYLLWACPEAEPDQCTACSIKLHLRTLCRLSGLPPSGSVALHAP
jgi:hypothetical protein